MLKPAESSRNLFQQDFSFNHRFQWVVIALLLLATGLRFHGLGAQSFWNDEGNSARLSERPIPAIIEGTASDIHPPLYYLLLHSWRGVVGESEFGLRAFSAFVGIGTVALTYVLGTAIGWRWSAMVAAGLTAVNPALVYYSQETRMYALLAFEAALSTFLLICWLQRQGIHVLAKKQRPRNRAMGVLVIAYVLTAVAGLYTHYFFPAVLLAHTLIVLFHSFTLSPLLLRWVAIMAAIIVLYLPWLPIFIRQAGGRPTDRAPFLQFLSDSGRFLAFGHTIQPSEVVWPLAAVLGLFVLGVIVGGWQSAVIATACLIPVLFMFAAGTTQPEFFKFMLVAIPPFCLVLANSGRRLAFGRFSLFLLLFVLFGGNGRSLQNLYFNSAYVRADYRGMAARIALEAHSNAGIILDAPNQWEVFTYYHREGAPVYPLPKGRPDLALIEAELSQIAASHARIYAIFWGEAQRDPERLVERWLDTHAFKTTDEWVRDVRFVMYAVPQEAATEIETVVNLPFGDAISLKGYTLATNELAPGDILQVTLFWETAESLSQRYKVFLHLVNANGQLVAQRDSEPGGGLTITPTWRPGQTILDNHGVLIPADTPAGQYKLLLGLYDLTDPTFRLPIHASTGITDAFLLATLVVR